MQNFIAKSIYGTNEIINWGSDRRSSEANYKQSGMISTIFVTNYGSLLNFYLECLKQVGLVMIESKIKLGSVFKSWWMKKNEFIVNLIVDKIKD